MVDAFAIMHTWPDVRNAEYEVLQRLIAAAANVGQAVAVIDNGGRILWATPELKLVVGEILPSAAVRYVLSLHFQSPRVLDIYSYYTLWQPIEFYYDFGYAASLNKLLTHNDLVSCDSDLADAHALNYFGGAGRQPLEPLLRMFHAPAQPYYEPNITADAKLFYIGINWERIGRPKGRFHDTLVSLDQQGLTSIYGPEKILGVAPWDGFQTYQGELPFDGRSVMRAINRAGICLALSSAQHRNTGIMSNRLFEGFAGGAAVIATPNSIIDKHFRDCVYLVDDSRGEEVLGQMIVEAVREIRANREEAARRAKEGQRIVREICSLEKSLLAMADDHDRRVAHFQTEFLSERAEVTVVIVDDYGSTDLLRERLADYGSQLRCAVDLHIICDDLVAAQLAQGSAASGAVRSLSIHGRSFNPGAREFDGVKPVPARSGPAVFAILEAAETPYFCIAGATDILFRDHLASLAKALDERHDAACAASGLITQRRDADGRTQRIISDVRFADLDALLLVNGARQRARFMFRRSLLNNGWRQLMSLLDGEEVRLFQLAALLAGDVAQTSYASYVSDEALARLPRPVADPPVVQQQYIRDRFSADPRWLDRLSRSAKLPEFVYAYAPGAPIRWQDSTIPASSMPKMKLDQIKPTRTGGSGLAFLGAGFSNPEDGHTWLAAERGVIEFRLDATDLRSALDYEIVLLGAGRRSVETGREQHCTVVLNGSTIAFMAVPDYATELRIPIPVHLLRVNSAFRLEIFPEHWEPVAATDAGQDPRRLSIALTGIGVMSIKAEAIPQLKVGRIYSCGAGEIGAAMLARGFYAPEPDLCWIAGGKADAYFAVRDKPEDPALLLDVRTRCAADGRDQVLTLALNGRRIGQFALPGDAVRRLVVPVDAADLITYGRLEIGVRHFEVTRNDNDVIVDARLLGCAVFAVGIVHAEDYASSIAETARLAVSRGDAR